MPTNQPVRQTKQSTNQPIH